MREFFFRLVSLTFDAAILKEIENRKTPTSQIGNNLVSE